MNRKEDLIKEQIIRENTIKCKCGHSIVIYGAERVLCTWCGNFVYKNAKIEFEYKLKQKLKEVK